MPDSSKNQFLLPFILLTSLFFMWGFITVLVDFLIPRLKEIFELSYFQAFMVQFAFFGAYGLVSIPAGQLLSRIGYKKGMILGLVIMALGCALFWPAAGLRLFWLFMLGYFILAAGMTVLQVAANPFVAVLGPERTASSRLNLAQAFNSLGTTIAPLVGSMLILSDHILSELEIEALSASAKEAYYSAEASAVQMPFVALAMSLGLLALIVVVAKLPKLLSNNNSVGYEGIFRRKKLMYGALGIFLYVGAEVTIGTALVNYFMDMKMAPLVASSPKMMGIAEWIMNTFGKSANTSDPKALLGLFVTLYWGGAMVGRFIGSKINTVFQPARVLMLAGSMAIALVIISMTSSGFVSMWSILLVGLFNSIMFPTLFTEAIEGLGENKTKGSGILCTAIVGGAIIPPLYGLHTDMFGFKPAFVLILACYGYITWYAFRSPQLSNSDDTWN